MGVPRRLRFIALTTTLMIGTWSAITRPLTAAAATPPPTPIGATTLIDPGSCAISGWASNPGYAGPIRVHVYSGGPAGQGGTFLAWITANLPSNDGSNDAYEYIFPTGFRNTVYVYAIGTDGSGNPDSNNPLLPVSGSRQLTCASPPSSGEGSQTIAVPQLGISVTLGQVAPLMHQGDYGITGGAPDGHMSALVNSGTETFFTCYSNTLSDEFSCASRNYDIDHFYNLTRLISSNGTFSTVMPGKVAGDPYQSLYAAISATWRDPSTGTIHAWYHEEVPVPGCTNGARYASIGYATSTDGGTTFIKQGPALTSPDPMTSRCEQQGLNLPEVIPSAGYLYMFFDYWNAQGTGIEGTGIARALQSNPTSWAKWYNGGFTEPAIGGRVTPIIADTTAGNQLHWEASVIWSQALGKWVMLNTDFGHEGAIYIRTSTDLMTWTPQYLVVAATPAGGYRYPTLFGKDATQMGYAGWLYSGRTPAGGFIGVDTILVRRAITITPA
jgi:hypothetical protein